MRLPYIIAQVMQRFSKYLAHASALVSLCAVLQSVVLASSARKQPERPHILGIDHVSIYVSDIEKSRHFYSEVLGLTTGCPQHTGAEPCYLVAPSDQRVLLKKVPAQTKNWLAEVGFITLKTAYDRWISEPNAQDLSQLIRASLDQLKGIVTGAVLQEIKGRQNEEGRVSDC